MKSNARFHDDRAEESVSSDELQTPESNWMTPSRTPCARVLLAIDVPLAILPEIKADWARVTASKSRVKASKSAARDSTPAVVASALGRLQRHAMDVAGAAVVEFHENPLAAWATPRAAGIPD